jgi:hypothetical protein
VLRPLVNQPQITLFMATIGLTFFIEGVAQLTWGAQVHALDLGIADEPIQWLMDHTGMNISKFDLVASGIAAGLVTMLALFFNKTRTGRALRAVADDHQAALAVGISLQKIWVIVWTTAGFVALVTGLLWGARNGVQFALTFLALKALPVLVLGGLTRSRRHRRRPIVAPPKTRRGLHRAACRRRIDPGFPRARAFLVRPGPLWRKAHRPCLIRAGLTMLYRERAVQEPDYALDQQLFPIRRDRILRSSLSWRWLTSACRSPPRHPVSPARSTSTTGSAAC